ncbi:MAG: coagulation factor 5/8 type domain-containing protein [Salinisphaera sp.]
MCRTSRARLGSRDVRWSIAPYGVMLVVLITLMLMGIAPRSASAHAEHGMPHHPGQRDARDFGPNVVVFDPSMPLSQIQAKVDAIAKQQVDSEMGRQRYALLFKPGTYGSASHPLVFQVGYYTEVAGLGATPGDVTIHGQVDVYNRCLQSDNCTALDNFWRSLSNLKIDVAGGTNCRANTEFWAVSQAAPLRRVQVINGTTTLMDYCTAGPQYASGGFMANSELGPVINGSQQQFFVRDSKIGSWSNAVWNVVFSGVKGAPPQSFPNPPYTSLQTNPSSRGRPFLFVNTVGRYEVFVPAARTASSGPNWANGPTPGHAVPLGDFFLVHPGDSVKRINRALSRGRNLIFTPGVYHIDRTIRVKRPNTLVLGLGFATLTAEHGAVPIRVADVPGVDIAGLMIDAGATNSPALMVIGSHHGRFGDHHHGRHDGHDRGPGHERRHRIHGSKADPVGLQDVFFRIGGPHPGNATVSLIVNSDDVILDDIWAWRADHGKPGAFGWTVSRARNGLIVNGDDVTATGLFVEHYQQYNVIWNGNGGKTIFFQNELPYDAPDQAAWEHDGLQGWAAYKVAPWVTTHELWGGGSYIFTNVNPSLHASRAFAVPLAPGVLVHDLLTANLGAGTIDHVINETGDPVSSAATGQPSYVASYP